MRKASLALIALLSVSTIARAQTVRGAVVDGADHPISGVQLVLLDTASAVSARTVSDEHGEYQLTAAGAGLHRLRATRIGYKQFLSGARMLAAGETATARLRLVDLPFALDTVAVSASGTTSIDDIRRSGFGHVLTREDLAKHDDERLSAVLAHIPGLEMVTGTSGRAWVASARGVAMNPPKLTRSDIVAGAKAGRCYALVFLNGALLYSGADGQELFDVNSLPTNEIESVQFFAGPAQTPGQYTRLNAHCGSLVIQMRH